ncbi:MAG: DUF3857 domain-containing protein [Candidatus Acidiferrales bacterium]
MGVSRRFFLSFPLLAIICLAAALPSAARSKDNWLPINPADLALKDNPASPGSNAMILYREESVDDSRHTQSEYYRIKIFTDAGKKWADVEIPYSRGLESVADVRARTILSNGSIVNFSGKIYDRVAVKAGGVKIYEKTFSLPDVQPGAIIEYKYNEPFDPGQYFAVMEWDVQKSLYLRDGKFTFVELNDIQQTGYGYFAWRTLFLPPGTHPQKQTDGSFVLTVHNISGLVDEPYSVPRDMLRSRVEFYYTQHSKETTEQFWKRTGKDWSKKLDSFVNKKGALEKDLAATIHPNDPPETKLREIYSRVQKVRNLSFEQTKTTQEEKRQKMAVNANVQDVLKHNYGTWQDINALYVGLARAAGFDATLVYVAPRDRTLFLPNYQDTGELQTNIVDVKLGSQDIYLDPSSPDYPYGLIPWYENAVRGLRVAKDGGVFVFIPPDDVSRAEILRHANFNLSPDGSISGTLAVDYVGQQGAVWRSGDRNDDDTGRRKDLHDQIKGWLPSNATFTITKLSDWDDNSKPIHVEGTVQIPSDSTGTLGRIILPMSLIQSGLARSFTAQQRVNDVYFHFPYQEQDDTLIQLPPGYKVESFPKVQTISRGAIQYSIDGNAQGGTVHLTRKLIVNGIDFPVKYYQTVRTIFDVVKTGDANDMVLEASTSASGN